MTYRVLVADDALEAVRAYLDYIAVSQQMPLTAARWWEKALARVVKFRHSAQLPGAIDETR